MDTAENIALPERVAHVKVGDKDIYLVGTAHLSRESVEDVRATVEQVKPDAICVELCQSRYQALTQADSWSKMDIFKVVRQKKAVFMLAQLIMTSFYRRLGEKLDIQPGAEMLEGIDLAEKTGAKLVLADRNIEITLKRVWGYLGFWNKVKLFMQVTLGLFAHEEIDTSMIESLKKQDQLEAVMAEFAGKFPEIKKRLIDERDIYLAQEIRGAPGRTVVAVVGAGHVPGITRQIQEEHRLDGLRELPPKAKWPVIFKWGIPIAIIALLLYGFTKGSAHGIENVYIWVLVNGLLSAAGAALALAHPLTILSAFVAAPLTSLNPLVAAGWVAGLVQAIIKRPKVRDLEDLPDAIGSLKGFWTNPATRILLVVALANLGSVVGTWVAGGWIAARSVSNSQYTALFDGKTLNGWTVIDCNATVDSGDILITEGNGVVQTEGMYGDFVLEFEWKPLREANWDSGVYFRYDSIPTYYAWPDRYQINLRQGDEGNVESLPGARSEGLVKPGEWNRFKLTVQGTKASLQINGTPAWTADGLAEDPKQGYIALQAEVPGGGQHRFRNIRLTRLN
jgi:pheromone shutdown-related protein TraB